MFKKYDMVYEDDYLVHKQKKIDANDKNSKTIDVIIAKIPANNAEDHYPSLGKIQEYVAKKNESKNKNEHLKINMVWWADHSFYQYETIGFIDDIEDNGHDLVFVGFRSCGGNDLSMDIMEATENWCYHILGTDGTGNAATSNIVARHYQKALESGNWIDWAKVKAWCDLEIWWTTDIKKIEKLMNNPKNRIQERYRYYKFPHKNKVSMVEMYKESFLEN